MTGVVLMTALPPTEGHLALCRFAAEHCILENRRLLVLMCVLPDEPPGRGEHRDALAEALLEYGSNVRVEIQFSNDPQGPKSENDDEFWAHWVRVITRQTGERVTHLYSSEEYGYRLAEALSAVHVPYDPGRTLTHAKATFVRSNLAERFGQVIKPLRDRLRRRVVLFGQESTGKSTLARHLADSTNSVYAQEWARQYLEGLPTPETTSDRMNVIAQGQYAHERAAWKLAEDRGCPFVFYDTDILSTIGFDQYFSSFGRWSKDDQWTRRQNFLEKHFTPADLYLVCAPTIDLESDPLRYASQGSVVRERETSMKFWTNILDERQLPYFVVSETGTERYAQALGAVRKCLADRAGFCDYVRRA